MATAQELLNNYLTTYSDPGALQADLEKRVKTINEPTISGLMRDAGELAPRAYGDFAQAFVGQGDARGMSPSARIANAQFKGAEAMNNLNQNKALRQYWGTSIQDWIDRLSQQMQLGQQGALQAYQLQNESEQQAWERQMAEKQLAAQLSALNNQPGAVDTEVVDPTSAEKAIYGFQNNLGKTVKKGVTNIGNKLKNFTQNPLGTLAQYGGSQLSNWFRNPFISTNKVGIGGEKRGPLI